MNKKKIKRIKKEKLLPMYREAIEKQKGTAWKTLRVETTITGNERNQQLFVE